MKEFLPLESVRPIRTPAPYLGGKRGLSRQLVERISATEHDLYAEPCVGMGGVFFRRTARPKVEVINDISGDVATLFRVLQEHYPYFMDMLRWRLTSRAEFSRLLDLPGDRLTDLQRAARFLYVQRLAFGGQVDRRTFGVSRTAPARFDVTKLEPMLADIHERLAHVVIEQLPYDLFIERYDRPGTLFFIDPPYWGNESDYGAGVFGREDFDRIRGLLEGLQGRFIMTINDRPETRAMFSAFRIEPVRLNYRVSGSVTEGRELIISSA